MADWNDDKNLEVLQNIEASIVEIYREDPSLLDVDAKDALDALVRHYHSQEEQRTPPEHRLSDRARRVFDNAVEICEWRLGRIGSDDLPLTPITLPELVNCLRKIQKSISLWTKQGGRRSYLDFVSPYLA